MLACNILFTTSNWRKEIIFRKTYIYLIIKSVWHLTFSLKVMLKEDSTITYIFNTIYLHILYTYNGVFNERECYSTNNKPFYMRFTPVSLADTDNLSFVYLTKRISTLSVYKKNIRKLRNKLIVEVIKNL